jgi:hypothetical protein
MRCDGVDFGSILQTSSGIKRDDDDDGDLSIAMKKLPARYSGTADVTALDQR